MRKAAHNQQIKAYRSLNITSEAVENVCANYYGATMHCQ